MNISICKEKKKRVLYVDPICYGAHRRYNYNNIRLLSKTCLLSVYIRDNYLDLTGINVDEILFWDEKYCWDNISHDSRLSFFLKTQKALFHNYKAAFKLNKKNKYDLIVFSCLDLPLFSLLTKFKNNRNIAFIDHGIYLSLERKSYKLFWKYLNRHLKVCVLEEYMYPYLRKQLKIKNDIFLIRHPLGDLFDKNQEKDKKKKNNIMLFAPSSSNSLKIANELKAYSSAIPNNIIIFYKSNFDYCNKNLHIYSDLLDRTRYEELFSSADGIIVPYEENYNFRTSGVIFEAIANNKPIFIKDGNTLEYYVNKYPAIFHKFVDVKDLLGILLECEIFKSESINFNSFKSDYCDDELVNEFSRLLNNQSMG